MPFHWENIGQKIHPKSSFREKLRADIYELSTKKEELFFRNFLKKIGLPETSLYFRKKDFPLPFSLSHFFGEIQDGIRAFFSHPFLVWPSLIAASLLFVPLLFPPASEQSIALTPTLIRNIDGEVSVIKNSETSRAESSQEIFTGQTVQTGPHASAEIIFFEGSSVRIDENTTIEITALSPHPLFLEAGAVEVLVKKGRIWGTTFQNAKSGLGMVITTSESVFMPERSSFDITVSEGKTKARVFSRSLLVSTIGVTTESSVHLQRSQGALFSPFEEPLIEPLSSDDWVDPWVMENEKKDEAYRTEFLKQMTARMQERLLVTDFSHEIEKFFAGEPSNEEVAILFSRINDALLIATAKNEPLEESSLQSVSESIPLLENIENANGSLADGISISSTLLKENEKTTTTQPPLRKTVTTQKKVYTQKQESPQGEKPVESIPSDAPPQSVESTEEEILPETMLPLTAEEALQEKREAFYESAADSFKEQVEMFDAKTSRENQAEYLLQKIEDKPENVELLKTLEQEAPSDVKRLIKEKRREIEEQ